MVFKDLRERTVAVFRIVGLLLIAIVAAMAVVWLNVELTARTIALALMLSAGPAFLGLAAFFLWMSMGPSRYRDLLQRGLRGHADIKEVTMTGARVNAMPVLRLSLDVTVPSRPVYRTSTRVLAYPMTIPDSGTCECVVDPDKPQTVEVFLDRARERSSAFGAG